MPELSTSTSSHYPEPTSAAKEIAYDVSHIERRVSAPLVQMHGFAYEATSQFSVLAKPWKSSAQYPSYGYMRNLENFEKNYSTCDSSF